jgi:hypothetical protein
MLKSKSSLLQVDHPFCQPIKSVTSTHQLFKKIKWPQHWIGGVFFARAVSPCQKWWQSLLGREISCNHWEDPSMHSWCLAFFPFMFWGGGVGHGGGRFFFIFPRLPNVFTLCSFQVPNGFPTFSPYLLTFFQYMPWKMVFSFHAY